MIQVSGQASGHMSGDQTNSESGSLTPSITKVGGKFLGSTHLLQKKADMLKSKEPTKLEEQLMNKKSNKELSINNFVLQAIIGQGAYGKVFLGSFEGDKYAIKQLSKEFLMKTNKVKSVFRERDLLIYN